MLYNPLKDPEVMIQIQEKRLRDELTRQKKSLSARLVTAGDTEKSALLRQISQLDERLSKIITP